MNSYQCYHFNSCFGGSRQVLSVLEHAQFSNMKELDFLTSMDTNHISLVLASLNNLPSEMRYVY